MIVVFPGHTLLLFDVSAVDSVKQKLSGKECDIALRALSWVSYHALPLPHRAVGVIVAVPGRTHLLFKLIFAIQLLKVVLQEQQNFLWWCPVSFAWVLRGILTMNQTQKWTYIILSCRFCEVVQINLLSDIYFSNIITFGMPRWR